MNNARRYLGIVVVLLLCIIMGVLYYCGFRITYAPELNNNWNAISSCAGWAGVLVSGAAVFVAINIPKRIAEQQNRIALFDKRYSAFNALTFLISAIKHILTNGGAIENKEIYLDKMVGTYISISMIGELTSTYEDLSNVYTNLILEAGKIRYVFEIAEEEIVIDFLYTVDKYISDVYSGRTVNDEDLRVKYDNLISSRIQDKLEEQMKR